MDSKRKNQNKKEHMPLVVLIAGIFCPIIFILYFLRRYYSDVSDTLVSINKNSHNVPNMADKENPENAYYNIENHQDSHTRRFVFTDGRGNYSESGGTFYDWGGNYVQWGECFTDHRGNLVPWGNPFYDNRDNYIEWGNPFYDAGDNYINPKG